MTAYTHPTPHRVALPTRHPARARVIPHVTNRIGALVAAIGLALALLSLYLPWLTSASAPGSRLSALGIADTIDVSGVAPALFAGLVALMVLVTVSAMTRLGAAAWAVVGLSLVVLVAHLIFLWVLHTSAGAPVPTLSGLPADASVTYGPYVAVLGFLLVLVGSVWAARSAQYLLPDREHDAAR